MNKMKLILFDPVILSKDEAQDGAREIQSCYGFAAPHFSGLTEAGYSPDRAARCSRGL